ncbi:MAG: flagellin [Geothrix sp.]
MTTILSNINALAASRQLGVSKLGLNQAITRLTTGRRVNSSYDDAASLTAGNTAQASARSAAASVVTDQAAYFTALNLDGGNQAKTQAAYRMAELEGSGNTGTAEYTSLKTLSGGNTSTLALAAIATSSATQASAMSTALTNAQLHGISAETQQGIADAYLGADMGAEMANLTKFQILMQAGTSALNSANQSAQAIMGLFR